MINLRLKACKFSGLFLTDDYLAYSYLALIYTDSYREKEANVAAVVIILDDILINKTLFLQGVIYSNAFIKDSKTINEKTVEIEIKNLEVLGHSNKNFLHWKSGYLMDPALNDFFDYLIIFNNTRNLMSNSSIFNSHF